MLSLSDFANSKVEELLSLTYKLCTIPAPSNHEENRATFCLDFFQKAGFENAYIDSALNCIAPYHDYVEKLLVITAHTDTVFPDTEPFNVKIEDDKAYCPAIGDDTVNLAALMLLAEFFIQNQPRTEYGILFVANSGEEGLGNLKGTRKLLETYKDRIVNFISLDGGPTGICNSAVGSKRYKISINTEGGHSFGAFGNRNAIERMSRLIQNLYSITPPHFDDIKTTYNVGSIVGGTSVNTIASHAEILYEYRSESRECLEFMEKAFIDVINTIRPDCQELKIELLGERPCIGIIDQEKESELIKRASLPIREIYNQEPSLYAGSTDCNIPLSLGIPSICFGIGTNGAHTYGEYINIKSVPNAFLLIARVLETYIL